MQIALDIQKSLFLDSNIGVILSTLPRYALKSLPWIKAGCNLTEV